MAITVSSLVLSHSNVASKERTTATVVIANSGGDDVTVSVTPKAPAGASMHFTTPEPDQTVPAGGSLSVSWDVAVDQPSQGDGRRAITYDIKALIAGSDGSHVNATGPTLTVVSGPNPPIYVSGPGGAVLADNLNTYMLAVL